MSTPRIFSPHEGLRLRRLRTDEPAPWRCSLCPRPPSLVWAVPSLGIATVTCAACAPGFLSQALQGYLKETKP